MIPGKMQLFYTARAKHGRPQGRIKKKTYQASTTQLVHRKCRFWKIRITRRNFLYFAFSTTVPKNGPKNGPKFKKRRKMTKTISPLLGDPI